MANGDAPRWNQIAIWLLTGFAVVLMAFGGYVVNKVDSLDAKKVDQARYDCDRQELLKKIDNMDGKLDRILFHQNGKRDRQ